MKWQKGQSGNPAGNNHLSKDLREFKKLTKRQVVEMLCRVSLMTPEDLKARMLDPSITAIELWICRVYVKGVELGDDRRLNTILDRIIGKVTDKVEYQLPKPTVVKMFGEDAVTVIGRVQEDEDNS